MCDAIKGSPPILGHNLSMATLGALLLWFGWFGFNAGSPMGLTDRVPVIRLNSNLAAAAGGMTALSVAWHLERLPNVGMVINGVLGGLVAITACCNIVEPMSAVAIGAVAGVVSVLGRYLLTRFKIDDVAGAIPVYVFCGVWVSLFGDVAAFVPVASRWEQLGIQTLGIATCAAWALTTGVLVLGGLLRLCSFRVSAHDERLGLNVAEHGASSELIELLTNMDQHRLDGDYNDQVPVEPQ